MAEGAGLQVEIPGQWAGKSLLAFLRGELKLSRKGIRDLKKNNGIFINGTQVRTAYQIRGGEFLNLVFPRPDQYIHSETLPISIVYEDDDLTVVNKPAGQVVHPVHEYQSGTLANGLIGHWRTTGAGSATFHPVHRLDRLTSGLVLIAKSPWVHQQMAVQLEDHHLHRLYLAVCKGIPPRASGKIAIPVTRMATPGDVSGQSVEATATIPDRASKVVHGVKWVVSPDGKPSTTRYRIVRKFPGACLMAVKLFSGRTHQIRIHLSHLGFPLWGDSLYGGFQADFIRPALHAVRLVFNHPRNHQKIRLRADIPPDFQFLLGKLCRNSSSDL